MVTSLWKLAKRLELRLLGACEVVLELAISGVKEELAIKRGRNFMEGLREEREI
jgi:hypothetical protein